jgi:hypothetical protein
VKSRGLGSGEGMAEAIPNHIGPSALAFHARIPQPTGCKRQLCRVFEGIQRKRVQADPSMRSPTTAAVHTS